MIQTVVKFQNEKELRNQKHIDSIQREVQPCVHHWVIDRQNVGTCKKCEAVKDFGRLLRQRKKALSFMGDGMYRAMPSPGRSGSK